MCNFMNVAAICVSASVCLSGLEFGGSYILGCSLILEERARIMKFVNVPCLSIWATK